MPFCRRSKYVDFAIFGSFFLLFVYLYFSRQVLLDRIDQKRTEQLKLEQMTNTLKEELKIVYYHTAKLEEALKLEQDGHKLTSVKLLTQTGDFNVNFTKIKRLHDLKIKAIEDDINKYSLENEELKVRHAKAVDDYTVLATKHKEISVQAHLDYDKLRVKKENESLALQKTIQEIYNKKIQFQKRALDIEDDYKKTLKKLIRCKSLLVKRNYSSATESPHLQAVADEYYVYHVTKPPATDFEREAVDLHPSSKYFTAKFFNPNVTNVQPLIL